MFPNTSNKSRRRIFDWRKFDKTIPVWLLRDALNIILQNFELNKVRDSENKIWNVDPEKTRRWNKMVNYIINTVFRLPSGEIYMKDGGLPSGSGFTNILGTICNAIATRYTVYHCAGGLPLYDIFMGDDSFFVVNGLTINFLDMEDFALKHLSMIINPIKSYVTSNPKNIIFLGYNNFHGYPVRSQDYLIVSFIYPERYIAEFDPMFTATRALGQLWSTLNGISAGRWLDIVEDVEQSYGLDQAWYQTFITEHPGTLRFLGLLGLDAQKLYIPKRPGWKLDEVEPPLRSYRNPAERCRDILYLYKEFENNYMDDMEYFNTFMDIT